jgi:ABC-type glycerol-3-phosphate transport system permease component
MHSRQILERKLFLLTILLVAVGVMAASVTVTIPMMVLFFFFERRLVRGLSAGAMKG